MAFAFDQIKAEELNCKKVADLVLVLVSTQQDDLNLYSNINTFMSTGGTRFVPNMQSVTPKVPAPYLRTSTARIALDFILEKGGSAYLPVSMVEPFIDSGQLHKVKGVEDWYRPIYLSYRKSSTSVDAIMQVEKLVNED